MAKKKQIKKKKFINMEITRVKMNPEQAVLTCCSASGVRGAVTMTATHQCGWTSNCYEATGVDAASS